MAGARTLATQCQFWDLACLALPEHATQWGRSGMVTSAGTRLGLGRELFFRPVTTLEGLSAPMAAHVPLRYCTCRGVIYLAKVGQFTLCHL